MDSLSLSEEAFPHSQCACEGSVKIIYVNLSMFLWLSQFVFQLSSVLYLMILLVYSWE